MLRSLRLIYRHKKAKSQTRPNLRPMRLRPSLATPSPSLHRSRRKKVRRRKGHRVNLSLQ
jgi:hypothetical protein